MHKFFRKNSRVIVWVVVFAFLIGGGALGFGTYISARNMKNSGKAFATVNGKAINYAEYQQRLAAQSYQLSSMPASQALGYRYQTLDSLIDRELLLQEAKNQKIKVKVTDEDVDQYIEEVKTQYEIDDEQLTKALQAQNVTMAQWKQEIKGILEEDKKVEALLDKATGEVAVSEQEIKDSYEEVRLSNIFINKTEENDLAKARAEEALAKVKEGMDFVEAVKTYSEAGNVEKDGDLGFISRSEYSEEDNLMKAAFSLDVNEVSGVVETDNGYHILKVNEKKVAEGEEYEQAKEEIKQTLVKNKETEIQNEWFKNLKTEAKIVINAPHLAGYKALIEQDFETAVKLFNEAAELTPENDLYLGFVAAAYKSLEQPEKALATYEKAMGINPENWQNYYAAAQIYIDQEQNDKVVELLNKASENAGDEYMARYQIRALAGQVGATDIVEAQDAALEEIMQQIQAQQEADAKAAEEAANESENE